MSENEQVKLLCCPFCGGTELTKNRWSLDEGEADAIECNTCLAGTPAPVWNMRAHLLGLDSVARK